MSNNLLSVQLIRSLATIAMAFIPLQVFSTTPACFPTLQKEEMTQLPKCHQSGTGWSLPSHLNPTGSVFVNYEPSAILLLKEIARYLKAHAPHVHLVLIVNQDMNYSGPVKAPPNLSTFARDHLSGLKYSVVKINGMDAETYLRDPFLGAISNTGQPIIVGPPTSKREGQYWEKVSNQCGYELRDHSNLSKEKIPEVLDGGNFMVLPGNIVVADSYLRLKNHPSIPKEFGSEIEKASKAFFGLIRKANQKLILSSFDLPVLSHVDEMLSVVRTGVNKCDFALIVGSTQLGLDLSKNKEKLSDLVRQRALSLQKNSDLTMDFILKAVKKETGCSSIAQVRLPLLPADPETSDGVRSYDHPNPVNGIVLTPLSGPSYFITSLTGIKEFDRNIEKALNDAKISFKLIDAEGIASGGGGLHCSTNQFQMCRP